MSEFLLLAQSGPYDLASSPARSVPRYHQPTSIYWEQLPLLRSQFTKDADSTKYEYLQCHTLFAQILSLAGTQVNTRHIYLSTFLEHRRQDQMQMVSLTTAFF